MNTLLKSTVASLSIFMLCSMSANAQAPSIGWQKALGGTDVEQPHSIIQCPDSGFLVVGNTASADGDVMANHGLYDIWLVKLSKTGNIQWRRSLGGDSSDVPTQIRTTSDGGYILAGHTKSINGDVSFNHGGIDAWIVKLSDTGGILWEKTYGGSLNDVALAIEQTTDGGYIFAGWSASANGDLTMNKGNEDGWLVKLDSAGGISWQISMGGSDEDHFTAVEQTADGGYIVAGAVKSFDGDVTGFHTGVPGTHDIWAVKFTPSGAADWTKCLGGSGNDQCGDHAYSGAVHQAANGGYILAGWSNSTDGDVTGNHGDMDCWIVKLTPSGSIDWQKSYGGAGDDEANFIIQTPDGGYVFTGLCDSAGGDISSVHGGYDFWVVEIDSAGNKKWEKAYGGFGYECAFEINRTFEGNYIVTGFTNHSSGDVTGTKGSYDIWVVYLEMPLSTGDEPAYPEITIAPNPTQREIRILGMNDPATVRIYNGGGQLVKESHGANCISISELPQGMYYMWVFNEDGVLLKKGKILKM